MGGAAPVAAATASSRPLFFPAALDVLDGDGFILQVQGVFTRIRSGATLKLWVAARLNLLWWQQALGVDSLQMQTEWLQLEWVKNPKGFGFYL
jgi:hypothetical protein